MIQTLAEGEPVLGVTSVDNHLYVLREKPPGEIEVYDIETYTFLRRLTVSECGGVMSDMVGCGHNRCIYVSGASHVQRIEVPHGAITKWPVNDELGALSLTVTHNVLVTCYEVCKLKEFNSNGQLLREVVLPLDVCVPLHTVQLSRGELIVCHGDPDESLHRVCMIGSDGQVVKSYGGSPGSVIQQMSLPVHMAVDGNDFVFVADSGNSRVLLMSPSLRFIREVVSPEKLQICPFRLSLDIQRRRLYVAVNEFSDGKNEGGRGMVIITHIE